MITNDILNGDFKSRLFTNVIEEELSTKCLFTKVGEGLKKIFSSSPYKSVLVVCHDDNFLGQGNDVRKILQSINVFVSLISLGEENLTEDYMSMLYNGENAVVVIGDNELIDLVKAFSSGKNLFSVAIPTTCVMANVFTSYVKKIENGRVKNQKVKVLDAVIIDKAYYASNKKKYTAISYSLLVSKLITLIDYKIAVLGNFTKFNKRIYNYLKETVFTYGLQVSTFKNITDALAIGTLRLSITEELSDILSFGGENIVADVLFANVNAPIGELQLTAFYKLAPLYLLYLEEGYLTLSLPDLVSHVFEFSEFANIPEHSLLDGYSKFSPTETRKRVLSVAHSSLLKDLKFIKKTIGDVKKTYKFFYNAKQKLSSISPSDLKRYVKEGAYLSNGNLLAFMKDDGFADLICK